MAYLLSQFQMDWSSKPTDLVRTPEGFPLDDRIVHLACVRELLRYRDRKDWWMIPRNDYSETGCPTFEDSIEPLHTTSAAARCDSVMKKWGYLPVKV